MNSEAAKLYVLEASAIMKQIEQCAAVLRQVCDGEELTLQLHRLGSVAASLQDEVLDPLFAEYPDVKPAGYLL